MIKPIRLFGGVEQKDQKAYFVNKDGLGFWFISLGERTVGEAEILRDVTERIEDFDAANNRLILEIIHKNKETLNKEIQEKNPDAIPEDRLKKLAGRDLTLSLESYVRKLISDLEFSHPALYPYVERLTNYDPAKLMLSYQLACVRLAFLKRYVTKPEIVSQSPEDPEIGFIPLKSITEGGIVGINPDEFSYDDLGEPLALEIYSFIQNEFRGEKHKTSRIKELEEKEAQPVETPAAINDEGKQLVRNELPTSNELEKLP
jgi:hypothetical protein